MNALNNMPNGDTVANEVANLPANTRECNLAGDMATLDPSRENLPGGYSLQSDGVYQLRPSAGDDLDLIKICSPLLVKGICRNADQKSWGRVVSVQDPDGSWHDLILEQRAINKRSKSALDGLFDLGLELSAAHKAAESVVELLASWRPEDRYLRTNSLGWIDGSLTAFALANGRILGDAKVIAERVSQDVMASMKTSGTLKAWRETVAAPCEGNPMLMMVVSYAFAGPLLRLMGRQGGGFHLVGKSTRGKSTLVEAAASVWGSPSFVRTWRATDNGIESVAAACNDTLLILDEMHQIDARLVGDVVYTLANGVGKLRMASGGMAQTTSQWTIPVLSTGELSLEDHMASAGRKTFAGQGVRLISLNADGRCYGAFDTLHGEIEPQHFVERVKRAAAENHGWAGVQFVEKLMRLKSPSDVLQRCADTRCNGWSRALDIPKDPQVHRIMSRFVMAALAGELATRFGLTGWKRGLAQRAAFEMFRAWYEDSGNGTKSDMDEAVQRTRDYVSRNLGRFLCLGGQGGTMHDGWRDQDWVYITPECWRSIHGEEHALDAARMHDASGFLRTQKGDSLQFRMGRDVSGRPRVYAVRLAELIDEDAVQ